MLMTVQRSTYFILKFLDLLRLCCSSSIPELSAGADGAVLPDVLEP